MIVAEKILYEMAFGVEVEIVNFLLPEVKKDEKNLIALCNCSVPRKAFLQVAKLHQKIEDLPEEEKKELKEYVIKLFPGKGINELVENCRIINLVGQII